MSRRLLALYCALLLLLPACKQGGEAGQSGNGGYQVYFAVPFGGEGDPGEAGGRPWPARSEGCRRGPTSPED